MFTNNRAPGLELIEIPKNHQNNNEIRELTRYPITLASNFEVLTKEETSPTS